MTGLQVTYDEGYEQPWSIVEIGSGVIDSFPKKSWAVDVAKEEVREGPYEYVEIHTKNGSVSWTYHGG